MGLVILNWINWFKITCHLEFAALNNYLQWRIVVFALTESWIILWFRFFLSSSILELIWQFQCTILNIHFEIMECFLLLLFFFYLCKVRRGKYICIFIVREKEKRIKIVQDLRIVRICKRFCVEDKFDKQFLDEETFAE